MMTSSIILTSPTVFVPPNTFAVYCGRTAEHPIRCVRLRKKRKNIVLRTAAIGEVLAEADPGQALTTWQIIVGSLAGVTPFVVAGIEFSKRIAAQRSCRVCKGSGLVLRDKKYYFRCPKCGGVIINLILIAIASSWASVAGGFLPWQSWKRFFSG